MEQCVSGNLNLRNIEINYKKSDFGRNFLLKFIVLPLYGTDNIGGIFVLNCWVCGGAVC